MCEDEKDLQMILETLHTWCTENQPTVNHEKSKVIHFRPQSVQSTHHTFTVGEKVIGTATQYTYLGLLLTEHMDYSIWPNMLQNQQTGYWALSFHGIKLLEA